MGAAVASRNDSCWQSQQHRLQESTAQHSTTQSQQHRMQESQSWHVYMNKSWQQISHHVASCPAAHSSPPPETAVAVQQQSCTSALTCCGSRLSVTGTGLERQGSELTVRWLHRTAAKGSLPPPKLNGFTVACCGVSHNPSVCCWDVPAHHHLGRSTPDGQLPIPTVILLGLVERRDQHLALTIFKGYECLIHSITCNQQPLRKLTLQHNVGGCC